MNLAMIYSCPPHHHSNYPSFYLTLLFFSINEEKQRWKNIGIETNKFGLKHEYLSLDYNWSDYRWILYKISNDPINNSCVSRRVSPNAWFTNFSSIISWKRYFSMEMNEIPSAQAMVWWKGPVVYSSSMVWTVDEKEMKPNNSESFVCFSLLHWVVGKNISGKMAQQQHKVSLATKWLIDGVCMLKYFYNDEKQIIVRIWFRFVVKL